MPNPNYKWLVLAVVSVGTAMSALDNGIVNVAYPEITRHFDVPVTTVSWVSLCYLLVSSASLATFGRVADIFGRKWIYLGGLVVFSLASLLCAFAPNIWFLLAARGLEGVGVAMALSNSIALVSEVFPGERRGMAIGVLETVVAVALSIGPTVGGFLVSSVGWRAIFLVNLPIGLVNILIGVFLLHNPAKATKPVPRRNLDLPGTLSFGLAIACLLISIMQGAEQGWFSPLPFGATLLFFITLTFFIRREKTIAAPAIDLNLFFGNRAFSVANFVKILAYCVFTSVNFMLPFYFDQLLKFEPATIGLALLPYTVAMTLGSFSSSFFADKFEPRRVAALGLGLMVGGSLVLVFSQPGAGWAVIIPGQLLTGYGMGLFITPNDKTIMNAAPQDRLGIAASVLALTRSLGMITGVALSSTLYSLTAGSKPGGPNFRPEQALNGFHLVFFSLAGLAFFGAGLLMVLLRNKTDLSLDKN